MGYLVDSSVSYELRLQACTDDNHVLIQSGSGIGQVVMQSGATGKILLQPGSGGVEIQGALSVSGGITGSLTGNVTGSCSGSSGSCTGNAETATSAGSVTNGVYTTGSYANPNWITALAGSKITGSVANATNASTAGSVSNSLSAGYGLSGGPYNGSAAVSLSVSYYGSNPAMDGTAHPGTNNSVSRGDHVHPTDTSRAAAFSGYTGTLRRIINVGTNPNTTNPGYRYQDDSYENGILTNTSTATWADQQL